MPGRNCPAAAELAAHRAKDAWAAMNKGAQRVTEVALVIAGILLWKWILVGLALIGLLVVGAVIGWFSVVRPRLRQRQADAELRMRRAWPLEQQQPGAVDGGQHLHIHLPSAEEARRFLGRGGQ